MANPSLTHSFRDSPVLRPSGLIALALVVAAVALMTMTGSRITISLFAQAAIISIMALSVGFLARTADLISFGHAAPFAFDRGQPRSTHMAMPMPPPMHRVARPFLASRLPIS